jgi:hypothetical protein
MLQLGLTSPMDITWLTYNFASHLTLHKLNQNALLESGYKHYMEGGAYRYTKVLRQAKSTKPKPWAQVTT